MAFQSRMLDVAEIELCKSRVRSKSGLVDLDIGDHALVLSKIAQQGLAMISRSEHLPSLLRGSFPLSTDLAGGVVQLPPPIFVGTPHRSSYATKWFGREVVIIDLLQATTAAAYANYIRLGSEPWLYVNDLLDLAGDLMFLHRHFELASHFADYCLSLNKNFSENAKGKGYSFFQANRYRTFIAESVAIFSLLGHEWAHFVLDTDCPLRDVLLELGEMNYRRTLEDFDNGQLDLKLKRTRESLIRQRKSIVEESACDYFAILFVICCGYWCGVYRQYAIITSVMSLDTIRHYGEVKFTLLSFLSGRAAPIPNTNILSPSEEYWQSVARRPLPWFFFCLEQAEFPACPDLAKIGITDAFFEFKVSEFFQIIDQWTEISKAFGEDRDSVFGPAVPDRRHWVEQQTDDRRRELRARVADLDYLGWRGFMSRSQDCLRANLDWCNEAEEGMPKIGTLDLPDASD